MFRPEHPKPQFRHDRWLNLNGTWNFDFDFGLSGEEKGWHEDPSGLKKQINVPFCPESKLSGIEYTDFIPAVWYHRSFTIPEEWKGSHIFLHFSAVDYDCKAWVNGKPVGRHYGGASSFSFDITEALVEGENQLVVSARDDIRSGIQPTGKQSTQLKSHGCDYTRTTGIWQTVWLEARPESHLEWVKIIPDIDNSCFILTPTIKKYKNGLVFKATLIADGKETASVSSTAGSGVSSTIDVPNPRLWSPSDPYLYDLRLELIDNGKIIDTVHSYAGLRKFHIEGNKFYLNNEIIFLRFVLDQGFYPDGIWTAPSDDELRADIERAMAIGFNGARLHQKVFEERFHYWADKLGYLTWGEYYDWGMDFANPQALYNQQKEWREIVIRDMNHPSIVAWTPFNESSGGHRADPEAHRRLVSDTYDMTHQLDPTRPVNDASGWVHVITDIYSMHNYEQDPEKFRQHYAEVTPDARRKFCVIIPALDIGYEGQPFVVDEYGGTWWDPDEAEKASGTDQKASWGYGNRPESIEEVYRRIEGLTAVLTEHPHIAGFAYTQLTDVEQEKNGIYTYDRRLKFDSNRLKKAFAAPAAIEKGKSNT